MQLDDIVGSIAELSGDAICVGYRGPEDEAARMVWVNDAFRTAFQVPVDADWKGRIVHFTIAPDHLDQYLDTVRPRFEAGDQAFGTETMCQRADGSTFWASIALIRLPDAPDGGRFSVAIHRDLSALREREDAARSVAEAHESLVIHARDTRTRLVSAINAMPDPVAIWDKDFRMVICNEAFSPRLLGKAKQISPGTSLTEILKEAAYSGQFVEAIGNEENWRREAEAALRAGPIRDRTEYTDGCVFRANSHAAPNGDTIVVTMDITELEEQRLQVEAVNASIRRLALHDDLTGLVNRRGFAKRMEDLKASGNEHVAVLQIDLDHFKAINDTMGHSAGDAVLIETARRLRDVVGPERVIARIGGDEFVVLFEGHKDAARATGIAYRLAEQLSLSVPFGSGQIRTAASIGIARTPLSSLDDILSDADIALYKAKGTGRARVAKFDVADRDELRARKRLADDVLRGIEADEFFPVFQPQIAAATGIAISVEVLARWQHPERGVLTPDSFLRAAEDLNVLDRIDRQVFEKALSIACNVFDRGLAPTLAFNVGRQRVMSPEVLESTEIAQSYPGHIAFELLETIFFDEEADAFLMQIDAIRDAGVSIELDDFGSGRASIVALQRIAPDRLKIDKELVQPMAESEQSRRLVRSIIDMGRALGIGVTAEGVETAAHARILTAYGCDRLQGYHFSAPQPLERLVERFWDGSLTDAKAVLRTNS